MAFLRFLSMILGWLYLKLFEIRILSLFEGDVHDGAR